MKVKKLMEELQKYDSEATVILKNYSAEKKFFAIVPLPKPKEGCYDTYSREFYELNHVPSFDLKVIILSLIEI